MRNAATTTILTYAVLALAGATPLFMPDELPHVAELHSASPADRVASDPVKPSDTHNLTPAKSTAEQMDRSVPGHAAQS